MSIERYFDDLFSNLPPGECLQLTDDKWQWIRARFGTGPDSVEGAAPQQVLRPSYGVGDLAREFDRHESTMRALLAAGVCGDPQALKPNGKSYCVGRTTVLRLLEAVAAGQPLSSFCLVTPRTLHESPEPIEPPGVAEPGMTSGIRDASTGRAPRAGATERQVPSAGPPTGKARAARDPKSTTPAARTRRRDRAIAPSDMDGWRAHVRG